MTVRAKISATTIKQLKPEDKRLTDTELAGFHARITSDGKIHYYLYYRINGKQVNYKLGTEGQITPAIARDLAKEKAGEVAKGTDVQEVKKQVRQIKKLEAMSTLGKFIETKFEPWLFSQNPKTAKARTDVLKASFNHLMDYQLSDIRPHLIEQWRIERKAKGNTNATINRQVTNLKSCLSRAVEWEVIDKHELHKIKPLPEDNSKVRYLSKDEEARLRAAMRERDERIKQERDNGNLHRTERNYELLPSLRDKTFADHLEPIVLLAMNTGMRRGEILSLCWDDISFETKTLTVQFANAKSGKTRHIPLNGEAYRTLQSWQADTDNNGIVFKGSTGKAMTDIGKAWDKLLADAGITNFRFHDLRHHFASKLVMASVDLNTVRELLGHGDLAMTLRYAHLAPEHKAAAVNLIG
ncbi:tyrosine-type recombinase/integrase [Alishewanella sp. d11]|uniref:tyrosine-type recombinase/integrase n=1 Tax=Alishewanella sp. d11 TaxID=3414030 RepID=UPI003BF79B1C